MKLRAPRYATQVFFGGAQYAVAPDGTVEVPDDADEALRPHGFTLPCGAEANPRRLALKDYPSKSQAKAAPARGSGSASGGAEAARGRR